MDKNTLSTFGWIIVTVIILSILIVFATPFGEKVTSEMMKIPDKLGDSFGLGTDTGPNNPNGPHTHSYTVQNIDDRYLLFDATCCSKATYYFSCSCGQKGSDTYEFGMFDEDRHTGGTREVVEYLDETYHRIDVICNGCDAVLSSTTENHNPDGSGNCPDCEEIETPHVHEYNVQDTSIEYRKSKATCVDKATYYYICSCKAIGTEHFEYGEVDAENHTGELENVYTWLNYNEHTVNPYCSSCTASLTPYEESHIDDGNGTCTLCNGSCTQPCAHESVWYGYEKHNESEHTVYVNCVNCSETIDSYNAGHNEQSGYVWIDKTQHKVNVNCSDCGETLDSYDEPHTDDGTGTCTLCNGSCTQPCAHESVWYGYVNYNESEHTVYVNCYNCSETFDSYEESHTNDGTDHCTLCYGEMECSHKFASTFYVWVDGYEHSVQSSCSCGELAEEPYNESHTDNGAGICSLCSGHVHVFYESYLSGYIRTEGTCSTPATYFYNCSCGEVSEDYYSGSTNPDNHEGQEESYTWESISEHYVWITCSGSSCDHVFYSGYEEHTDNGFGTCTLCEGSCGSGSGSGSGSGGESGDSGGGSVDGGDHSCAVSANPSYTNVYTPDADGWHDVTTKCLYCGEEVSTERVQCTFYSYVQTGCGRHDFVCVCGMTATNALGSNVSLNPAPCSSATGQCSHCGGSPHPYTDEDYYFIDMMTCMKTIRCRDCGEIVSTEGQNHEIDNGTGNCFNCGGGLSAN